MDCSGIRNSGAIAPTIVTSIQRHQPVLGSSVVRYVKDMFVVLLLLLQLSLSADRAPILL
jgi:hypothetical protein